MTTPLSSFSGVISGFNYKDLVDQIIQVEGRPAARLRSEVADNGDRLKAFTSYRGLLDKLRTAADAFRTGSALEATSATTTVETGTKPLATVTTTASASPASFTLQVSKLARAQKLGAIAEPSRTAALNLAGTFTVNGATVTVTAADSLNTLRDKINAANTGATPTKVTASILTVGAGEERLVLTSDVSGQAGAALADTTGSVLQTLGVLDGLGAIDPGAVLVGGRNAEFTIDGIPFVRTSNTVSDAITGVTLTLTSDEAGASTAIRVDRYADSAATAAQSFVDAYNGVMTFLKQQGTATDTARPVLYGETSIRSARSLLPTQLLQQVFGAAPDLATASAAGFSFQRDGTLKLDTAKFTDAFRDRYQDLRNLFLETRSASDPSVTFVSAGGNAASGTYAVAITTPATRAVVASTGFSGTYDAGATPDTLTITDNQSGHSVNVNLTTGMTTADIVLAMQTAIDGAELGITVSANGNDISLQHVSYGSLAGISAAVTGTGDGASELWAVPATSYGVDVAGTIGGQAATGAGQALVGNVGTPAAGLSLNYSGSAPGAAGTITLALGTGALVERVLDSYLQTATGSITRRESALSDRSDSLEARAATMEARLEQRRAALLRKFVAMESAIARLQNQSKSLSGLNKFGESS